MRAKLAGLIVRADAELAAQRAARARAERFVRGRQHGDGTAFITAKTDAPDALRLYRQLDQVADHLALGGDTGDVDVRRATALGVLATPPRPWPSSKAPNPGPAPAPRVAGLARGRVGRRRSSSSTSPPAPASAAASNSAPSSTTR